MWPHEERSRVGMVVNNLLYLSLGYHNYGLQGCKIKKGVALCDKTKGRLRCMKYIVELSCIF